MTQEEKAKAYDEALERARKIHNEILNNEILGFPDQIREIFPELRESEDERIREEIVDYFKKECECLLNDFRDKEDEKQLSFYNKAIAWLEKQKEQKPAEIAPNQFDGITYGMQGHSTDRPEDRFEEAREKYQVEWSDNDDQLIGFIFDLLNDLAWRKDWAMSKEECLERLKSLTMRCPKSSDNWRPSEEQMEVLYGILVGCRGTWGKDTVTTMESLYQNLKKLM